MDRVVRLAGVPVLAWVVCCCVSGVALGLPAGRVYEQVSPVYKAGYGAGLDAVAPDGESVAFLSYGTFGTGLQWAIEGASYYLARRSPAGWSTTSLAAPPITGFNDLSATLQYVLANGSLEASKEGVPASGHEYLLHRTDLPNTASSWELAGGIATKLLNDEPLNQGLYGGASADLCHIVFYKAEGPLLPEAESEPRAALYDLAAAPAGGCRGDGVRPLRIVSVKNTPAHGELEMMSSHCAAEAGLGLVYQGIAGKVQTSKWNSVAAGGEDIFFTTGLVKGNCSLVHQLFVRLGGERTLEVSKPVSEAAACGEEVPCPGAVTRASANFVGASEDGSRVFFQTTAVLSPEDKDAGNDLYMATIGCPEGEPGCATAQKQVTSLVQVSHGLSGEAAEAQRIVRIASDGSRIYFVATGVLSEGQNAEGKAPLKGADNLYVYDAQAGKLAFVTDGDIEEAQSNADGRFLVFSSYARLLKSDTDNAKDVYRYDALTGTLDRVSVGEAGYHANGNNNAFDASIPDGGVKGETETVFQQHEMGERAISEDGSRIVFSTTEPLSPDAVNEGILNVYEWHKQAGRAQGEVSLISSGTSTTNDCCATISASGLDVFFTTTVQLVGQDTDENNDVYDARLAHVPGERLDFSSTVAERQPCSGDACQGPLTNPVALLVPGSVSQAPGGNFAAPVSKPAVKAKKKLKPKPKRKVKKKGKASGRFGTRKKAAGRGGR